MQTQFYIASTQMQCNYDRSLDFISLNISIIDLDYMWLHLSVILEFTRAPKDHGVTERKKVYYSGKHS